MYFFLNLTHLTHLTPFFRHSIYFYFYIFSPRRIRYFFSHDLSFLKKVLDVLEIILMHCFIGLFLLTPFFKKVLEGVRSDFKGFFGNWGNIPIVVVFFIAVIREREGRAGNFPPLLRFGYKNKQHHSDLCIDCQLFFFNDF